MINYFYLKRLFNLAWQALWSNPFRSFLTTLGIIIGAMTIIVVVALGEGAKQDIEKQYSAMSVTTIIINAPSTADGERSKLSYEDAQMLSQLPSIAQVVPQLSGRVQMTNEGQSSSLGVIGSTEEIQSLINLELEKGRFFTAQDDEERQKVAVIGAIVAEELFGSKTADVVGKYITVGKKDFEIIGLLKYKGSSVGPTSVDDSIFAPYTTTYRYILGTSGKFNINAEAKDVKLISQALEEIAVSLRENHNLKAGSADDFRIRDMGSTVASAVNSSKTMQVLLGAVGLIVLLVGGIGIMNIMYVTVTERTKEIGVRKAIGAFEEHILIQFLMEAFILSFVGYLAGAIVSVFIILVIGSFGISVVSVWWSYILSFFVTMLIGIFFGFYPAKKAAELHPVDALRYE